MSSLALILEILRQAGPSSGFAAMAVAACMGLVFASLLAWFGQNAIRNHDTPRRLQAVESVIQHTIPIMQQDIASMKATMRHIEEQNKRILDRLDRAFPPNANRESDEYIGGMRRFGIHFSTLAAGPEGGHYVGKRWIGEANFC